MKYQHSVATISGTARPTVCLSVHGTWSHLWFAGVSECPPWCSFVGATVTQFFCILHSIRHLMSGPLVFHMLHFERYLSIENLVRYLELFSLRIYIHVPNIAWCYIAWQTLYSPFSGSKEHRFVLMTDTWRYPRRYTNVVPMICWCCVFGVGKYNISGIPENLGTNIPVYFPQSNDISV